MAAPVPYPGGVKTKPPFEMGVANYDDHELSGDWKGHRELHILPDWLLIYYIQDDTLVLNLSRTGTHSDLFKK